MHLQFSDFLDLRYNNSSDAFIPDLGPIVYSFMAI
jgi:hypothetical protein